MKVVFYGAVLTALVTGGLVAAWGESALLPGVSFGLLATGVQAVAVALARAALDRPFHVFMRRWGIGMALRMGGVVIFVAAVTLERGRFAPLPTALAYLCVLLPLLFAEIRLVR